VNDEPPVRLQRATLDELAQRRASRSPHWACPVCGNVWLRLGGVVCVEDGRITGWAGTLACPDHPDAVIATTTQS
jgi:hypothetical protein